MRETQVLSLDQEDSPGEGNGYPLQDSCLENPMDRGYSPWGRKQSGMTERLTLSFFFLFSNMLCVFKLEILDPTHGIMAEKKSFLC